MSNLAGEKTTISGITVYKASTKALDIDGRIPVDIESALEDSEVQEEVLSYINGILDRLDSTNSYRSSTVLSRTEAFEILANKLAADPSSPWAKLKGSLVGKELLVWGAEIISQAALQNQLLADSMYLESANERMIKVCAWSNDLKLDNVKPHAIKIRLATAESKIFGPFAVKVVIGGASYYNLDFVRSNEELILYQGTATLKSTKPNANWVTGLDNSLFTKNMRWDVHSTRAFGGDNGAYGAAPVYLKLTKQTLADSVRVFACRLGDTTVAYPISEYSPILRDGSGYENLYKVRLGRDNYQTVMFGDGIWGKAYSADMYDYIVYYLDATSTNVSTDATPKFYISETEIPTAAKAKTLKDRGEDVPVYGTLISVSNGGPATLEYMRSQLKSQLGSSVAVTTRQQIREFCNAQPTVLDCNPVLTGQNEVTVYVKPFDEADDAFNFIAFSLNMHGDMCVNYKSEVGKPFIFNIILSKASVTDSLKQKAAAKLLHDYAYRRLAYDGSSLESSVSEGISISGIGSKLASILGTVMVDLEIEEIVSASDKKLTFTPVIGTIKVYDSGDNVIGYDDAGQLVFTEPNGPSYGRFYWGAGDFLISLARRKAVELESGVMFEVNAQLSGLPSSDANVLLSDNQIMVEAAGKVYVMQIGEAFTKGDYSIQRVRNYVRPVQSFEGSIRANNNNAVLSGTDVYRVYDGTGEQSTTSMDRVAVSSLTWLDIEPLS